MNPDNCQMCGHAISPGEKVCGNCGDVQNRRSKKKKGPSQDWCAYCRNHVSEWRKRSTGSGENDYTYFNCPHCHKMHPYYKYHFLGCLGVFFGVGVMLAVLALLSQLEDEKFSNVTFGVVFCLGCVLAFGFNHFMWKLFEMAAYRTSGPPDSE